MRSLLLIAAVLVTGALALEPGQTCEPGSNFMVECNKCRCSSDGKLMSCTRKACVQDTFQGDDPKTQPEAEAAQDTGLVAEKMEEVVHTNGQVCKPNDSKVEGCNRCKCAANGIIWLCTRNACPREKRHALRASPPQCTPGTSFKSADGCNDCFCTETGIAACTMKFCFNDKVKREAPEPAKQCEPGTSFKSADGCNNCFCTETGIAACTMKFCFTNPKAKREAPSGYKCVKGTSYKDDCNTCFCGDNGVIACTRKFCVPKVKRDVQQKCTPGTTFKDAEGCNDCFCTADGRAACTEKLCIRPQKTKRDAPKPEKQCEPGTTFKSADGCNDCFCTETGIAACTMKFCFNDKVKREASALEKQCEPGTTFKDANNCNTCYCTESGIPVCTLMRCITLPNKTKRQVSIGQEAPKVDCKPGTSFKSADGCNDCYCTESGVAFCTLKGCFTRPLKSKRQVSIGQEAPKVDCKPGTSFKSTDGCNTCFCGENGVAACTQMFCFQKEKRSIDDLPQSKVAPWAENFECAPNKPFKFQCNTCRCDNTGKKAACTFKFCIDGEY